MLELRAGRGFLAVVAGLHPHAVDFEDTVIIVGIIVGMQGHLKIRHLQDGIFMRQLVGHAQHGICILVRDLRDVIEMEHDGIGIQELLLDFRILRRGEVGSLVIDRTLENDRGRLENAVEEEIPHLQFFILGTESGEFRIVAAHGIEGLDIRIVIEDRQIRNPFVACIRRIADGDFVISFIKEHGKYLQRFILLIDKQIIFS